MLVVMLPWLLACGQSAQNDKVRTDSDNGRHEIVFHYWSAEVEGAGIMVVTFAQYCGVFRGEYVDPGFLDKVSIPVFGTIDNEGNVNAVSASIPSGRGIRGTLQGKITDDTFHAVWSPTPEYGGQFWEVDLRKVPLTSEAAAQVREHPDAFCNILFPEHIIHMDDRVDRIVPLMPENVRTIKQLYGYHIGEWESKTIQLKPGTNDGEVWFRLQLSQEGLCSLQADMEGVAPWDGNRFRYKEKGYEFEVAVYQGFVVIQTIVGSIALGDACQDEDDVVFKADGVYPTPLNMNYYVNGAYVESAETNRTIEDEMFASIFSLPEVKAIENASVMIVDSPSVTKPYYTVKVGCNLEDHFVTSHWFYVYTTPDIEIRVYDVVTDAEMTLSEWRRTYGDENNLGVDK